MKRVALTGGLATGKSFVREAFADLGVPTFDADAAARAALAPGEPARAAVERRFGAAVMGPAGLDRRKLAEVVFADAAARLDLEAIVHPVVRRARDAWFRELGEPPSGYAVADIPLLFEAGLEGDFDVVVVAACAPETQVARAVARGGLTEAEARARIAAQWPIDDKADRADHVIRTDGTPEETTRQVRALHARLVA